MHWKSRCVLSCTLNFHLNYKCLTEAERQQVHTCNRREMQTAKVNMNIKYDKRIEQSIDDELKQLEQDYILTLTMSKEIFGQSPTMRFTSTDKHNKQIMYTIKMDMIQQKKH